MGSAFDSSMMQASLGQSQGRQLELQNRVRGLHESSSSRLTPEQKERKLREACQGFESIFIQKMWQQMRATLPQGGLLHSRDEKMWQDMYDQELAKSMAGAGGIGLADMMYEQLSRNLVSASRGAAGEAGRTSAFMAQAAPLIPSPEAERAVAARAAETTPAAPAPAPVQQMAMYEGYAPVSGVVEGAADGAEAVSAAPQASVAPQPQPVAAAQASTPPAENRQIQVRRHERSDQLSGLQMAQQAQRQAGDKLGNGVRPSSSRRRRNVEPMQQNPPASLARTGNDMMQPAPLNGPAATPAAMQAAMQPAMQQALFQPAQPVPPMNPAQVQAGQTQVPPFAQAGQVMPQAGVAQAAAAPAEQPEVVRIRYQTNMPKQAQQDLNQDLIRTLNVDAGGQKAGQGIRAYHAQGRNNPAARQALMPQQDGRLEAAQWQAQARQQEMNALQGMPQGQAPVSPLTGAQAAAQPQAVSAPQMAASGIPPLTAPQTGMGQNAQPRAAQGAGESRLSAEEALIAGVPLS